MKGNFVPIVMAFDSGFLLPSAVTMISVMENGNKAERYHFFIMTEPELAGMDGGLFDRIAGRYPNFSYEYVFFEDSIFAETRLPMHCPSRFTFARLLIAEMITSLDGCIYLDGDLLVRRDVAALWKTAMDRSFFEHSYLMAAPDLLMQNMENDFAERFRQRLVREDLHNYFNAGVMVMNLRKLR